jgi:serine phosphatase RsbU (regulator of sigma subunit)
MTLPSLSSLIDWAVAQRALPGEDVSGDLFLVQPHDRGVLFAVVDGVGHGPEAAHAAAIALEQLRVHPQESVHSLFGLCHAALTGTRGAVMTVASYHAADRTITWCGIGNVEGLLFRAGTPAGAAPSERALLRGGLLGAQLPPFYANVVPVHADDLLIFATDGLRADLEQDVPVRLPPQRVADHILAKYFKGNDDALVLVARFPESNHA